MIFVYLIFEKIQLSREPTMSDRKGFIDSSLHSDKIEFYGKNNDGRKLENFMDIVLTTTNKDCKKIESFINTVFKKQ